MIEMDPSRSHRPEIPGRPVDRLPCPACCETWADGEPVRSVVVRVGYGVGRDRGILSARCQHCGRTWRGMPELERMTAA